jgi:hypothetical protein
MLHDSSLRIYNDARTNTHQICIVVCIVIRLRTGLSGVQTGKGKEMFSLPQSAKTVSGYRDSLPEVKAVEA